MRSWAHAWWHHLWPGAGWEHATVGRFHGRWDDPDGSFRRTLYLGESLLACLLGVLAFARTDKHLAGAFVEIDEDPEDVRTYPAAEPGTLDPAWLGSRCAASAVLSGRYCQVTADDNATALDSHFIGDALDAGYDDFDAALLKNGAARAIGTAPVDCQSLRVGPGVGSEVLIGAA